MKNPCHNSIKAGEGNCNQQHLENSVSSQNQADYSEYLWMEDMESFDKQVMEQLEEQEFYEQCLAEDAERELLYQSCLNSDFPEEDEMFCLVVPDSVEPTSNEIELTQNIESLAIQEQNKSTDHLTSTLNPEAKEFIPESKVLVEPSENPDTCDR